MGFSCYASLVSLYLVQFLRLVCFCEKAIFEEYISCGIFVTLSYLEHFGGAYLVETLKEVFETFGQDGSIGKHGLPPHTTTSKL